MKCPFCGSSQSSVLESRVAIDCQSLRRRRECSKCERRFTTYERVEGPALMIVKKDQKREPFNRQKLVRGIQKAFHKRPVSVEELEKLIDSVEREILRKSSNEIQSQQIGTIALRKIKKIDKVAWLRFASVYMDFEDLSDFEKIIEKEN